MSCCRWTMPLGRPVEPDEYIQNAISLRWVSASASSAGKLCKPRDRQRSRFGTAWSPAAPLTTISVCNAVSLQADRIETRAKFGVGDRNGGAGIRQIELQQIRRRQRIDQQRHEAGAHRAEKRRRIGRRIVEEHQDAVAALQSQRDQGHGPSARPQRRVRHSCAVPAGPVSASRSPRPLARLSNRMRLAL